MLYALSIGPAGQGAPTDDTLQPAPAWPTAGQNNLDAHGTVEYALNPEDGQYAPTGHACGDVVPIVAQMLPNGQVKHANAKLVWPVALPKVPGPHHKGADSPSVGQ